ncbi:MAG: hypothetical protein LAO76_14445 [Acidobacteriia bacterium]|nr:hypothetical protein [Terriglobia bacterium]
MTNQKANRKIRKPGKTKEEIMSAITRCAEKLGRVPSLTDLQRTSKVSESAIRKHFGKYSWALRDCKLRTEGDSRKADMPDLFRDWATVARQLKKIPSVLEYTHLGNYSETPLRMRFGSWKHVPYGLKQYAEKHGLAEEWKDILELITANDKKAEGSMMQEQGEQSLKRWKALIDRPLYGAPMKPCALAYCPTNEAGVLFLFGSLAVELGFMVTGLQAAFPDCEAMRRVEGGKWQPIWIEFEYQSRNFLQHLHDPNGCDLIVCWEHNWPECPIEVIELRSLMGH